MEAIKPFILILFMTQLVYGKQHKVTINNKPQLHQAHQQPLIKLKISIPTDILSTLKLVQNDRQNFPLHASVSANDLQQGKRLISSGVDVNARSQNDLTPLHFAAYLNRIDFIKMLLKAKANVNLKASHGMTPLMAAIYNGNSKVMKLLLDAGSDPNLSISLNKFRVSYLLFAINKRNTDIVKMLIDAGADVNGHSDDYVTPLLSAMMTKYHDGIKLLLENKAKVDGIGKTSKVHPLMHSILQNETSIVKLLLDAGADPNTKTENNGIHTHVLIAAHHVGNMDIVKALIHAGTDVNVETDFEGTFPLLLGVTFGNTEFVKILIHAKADIEKKTLNGVNSLFWVVMKRKHDMVQLLLTSGADPNAICNNASIICTAIVTNNTDIRTLELLIDKAANVDTRCDGVPPIHVAVLSEKHGVLQSLLKANASVDAVDQHGCTALHSAVQNGNLDATKLLIRFGADQTIDLNGLIPISMAMQNENTEILQFLLHELTDTQLDRLDLKAQRMIKSMKRLWSKEEL